MSDQEILQENERLRRELAEVTKSRDRLREMVCSLMPIDRTEITPEDFDRILKNAKPVDELMRDILPADVQRLVLGD